MASSCAACCRSLPISRDRRTVSSVSEALQRIVGDASSNPDAAASYLACSRHVCKACFAVLQKYGKIQLSLQHMISCIRQKLSQIEGSADPGPSDSDSHKTKKKRCRETSDDISTPNPKRICSSAKLTCAPRRLVHDLDSNASPHVSVAVWNHRRTRYFHLSKSLKTLGRYVGRGSKRSIAAEAVKDPKLRPYIISEVCKLVSNEVKEVCSTKHDSILRMKTKPAVEGFTWDRVWGELKEKVPVLLQILREATPHQSLHTVKPALCMCVNILLKLRNPHMNLLQGMISIVLRTGHATKQTYRRLQKLMLCLSHQATLNMLDIIGEGHDEKVLGWRESLVPRITDDTSLQYGLHNQSLESAAFLSFSVEQDQSESLTTSTEDLLPSELPCTPEAPPYSPILSSTPVAEITSPTQGPQSMQVSQDMIDHPPLQVKSPMQSPKSSSWCGFKVVGDNIDKNVHPRHESLDHRTQSLHYFNCYAVKDRCDLGSFSDLKPLPDTCQVDLTKLLPHREDLDEILANMTILAARVLTAHIDKFQKYQKLVPVHIKHQYSQEMSSKSTVVPLGIIMRNENKVDEMVCILDELHQYVPTTRKEMEVFVPNETEPDVLEVDTFHQILLGGDQLTVARSVSAQAVRQNSENGRTKLQGFEPAIEDWHAKMCFMEVIWKRMFKMDSGSEGGTMRQLQILINRRNLKKSPKEDMNAAQDFMGIITVSHLIAAALKYFGMADIHASPQGLDEVNSASGENKPRVFLNIIQNMLKQHLLMHEMTSHPPEKSDDQVTLYARELLTLGMILHEFQDAVKEGDGHRVICIWKLLLPVFSAAKRKNYAIQSFNLLAKCHYLSSPRVKQQLIWSRFVNTRGVPGGNIEMDLHMEHINRTIKLVLASQGSNLKPRSIQRIGKIAGALEAVTKQFDQHSSVSPQGSKHASVSYKKDMERIVHQLHSKTGVFFEKSGRMHRSFGKLDGHITLTLCTPLNYDKLMQWMKKHFYNLTH